MNKLDYKILQSMETRGGGFASALAKAAYQADDVNFQKIKEAFSELWERHTPWIDMATGRPVEPDLEMINNERKDSE